MTADRARAWKKIGAFYTLAVLISSFFWVLGDWKITNITLLTGLMWSPALAAFLTKWLFSESVRDLGWGWRTGRFEEYGYLLPFVYAVPVYGAVWLTGLGGFYDTGYLAKVSTEFNLSSLPATLQIAAFSTITLTAGFIPKLARALGEEIGWRGFLVPELAKVTGVAGVGLISGVMWALWHFPVIVFGNYNAGTPNGYALSCFTVMVVSLGFIAAWLRLKSDSVWPAAIIHASHNTLIQLILTPLTTDTGSTAYVIDEFGAGLAISTTIVAVILWRKSGAVPARLNAPS